MRISRRAVVTSSAVVVVAAGVVAGVALLARERIWQPATHEFRTKCDSSCDSLGAMHIKELGNVVVYAQPRVDDDVTQWAGCLDDVLTCMANNPSRDCVARSRCPTVCKTRYAAATATIADSTELLSELERVFLSDSAYCAPR